MQTKIVSPSSFSFCNSHHYNPNLSHHLLNLKSKHEVSKIMCTSDKDQVKSSNDGWKKWMAGIVLSVAIPSIGNKSGPLLLLKSKIDSAIKTAECVTEAVEELAEEADKFIERIEENLPENSKLKGSLDKLDALAHQAEKEAKKTEKLIHQVEDMEKEVEAALLKSMSSQKTKTKN